MMARLMVDDRRAKWVHITLHYPSYPFRASLVKLGKYINQWLVRRLTRQSTYLNLKLMHFFNFKFYLNFFGGTAEPFPGSVGPSPPCTRPKPFIYTRYRMVYSIHSHWSIHTYSQVFFFGKWSPIMCTHTQYSGGWIDHLWIRGDLVSDSSGTRYGRSHNPDYWAGFNSPPLVTLNDEADWLLQMPSLRVDA